MLAPKTSKSGPNAALSANYELKVMEYERNGKDAGWLLTHPRELCKKCWEWCECSGEPWDDMSGCSARTSITGNDYLLGRSDECRYFLED